MPGGAASIGPADSTAYTVARRAQGASSSTIRKELALLGKLLRVAYANGKLTRLPVLEKPQEGPARAGFFEAEQFEAVRRHLRPDLQVAATIGYTFGWRKGEVLGLGWRHVDLTVGSLRLDPGSPKNGEVRVVYLTPEVARLLGEQREAHPYPPEAARRDYPLVFPYRPRAAGRPGCASRASISLGRGLPERRGAQPPLPRPPAHGGAEHGAGRVPAPSPPS